jgi:predicted  nucleic acid-binding Zn-ribbon protein
MGYAIVGGLGILLGLGLMIWALRERAARHEAERATDKAVKERDTASRIADANRAQALKLDKERRRLEMQIGALRIRLDEAWESLAKSGDPKAVKDWLDKELSAEEI